MIRRGHGFQLSLRTLIFLSMAAGIGAAWIYDRVPAIPMVPVLGPLTSAGKPYALEPPSDDEVLRAVAKAYPEDRGLANQVARIVREEINDYVDPVREVPLIGPAQLHHVQYKVSIYYADAAQPSRIVYIDHNHFHSETPGLRAKSKAETTMVEKIILEAMCSQQLHIDAYFDLEQYEWSR